MPVQVSVARLAAQAQAVHPLDRHDFGHRRGDPAHHALQRQELLLAHVADPVFDVPFRSNNAVTEQRRVAVEEGNGVSVLIDIVMAIARIPGQDRADKARTLKGPARIPAGIERHATRLKLIHPCSMAMPRTI